MFYGDTISFTVDFARNRGLVAEYLLWDIMAQLECPTGHAVLPLPVTEAVRVASAEELAEAQSSGHRIEESARRFLPYVDFSASRSFANKITSLGKTVFSNSLSGLKQAGVNTNDPLQMIYVLKKLGPLIFEDMFGVGEIDADHQDSRKPVVPTDVYTMSLEYIEKFRPIFLEPALKNKVKGRRILIASSDVHEYALLLINQLLAEAGAEMINLGAEKNPDQVAEQASLKEVEAILISTHNGMALEYAKRLKDELEKQNVKIPVLMGGVLNQKVEDKILPVDVTENIREIGFYAYKRLYGGFLKMLEKKI